MIKDLLPLTENKLRILGYVYEKNETHLLDISKNLKIHPYSLQKTLKSLKKFLEKRKSGRTVIITLNKLNTNYHELLYILEDYKLETNNRTLKLLIKNLRELFSRDNDVLTCCVFGSYARKAFTKESDVDLLFVIRSGERKILKKCNYISTLLNKEINPIIMKEREFLSALKIKEPTLSSILEPPQRLIVIGKEYFIRNTTF